MSGKSLGTFLRDEVTTPLGIADEMYVGAPESVEPRIAKLKSRMTLTPEVMEMFSAQIAAMGAAPGETPLFMRAMGMRPGTMMAARPRTKVTCSTRPPAHRAEVPAANGIMTARALARMYATLGNYGELDGVRLMSEQRVRTMSERQTFRQELVIMVPIGWALGYMTGGTEGWPQGPRVTSFGHAGLGGSIGFCDPEIEMGFGFVTNALSMDFIGYGRTAALAEAARTACEAKG